MLKLFSSVKEMQDELGRQDNWFINESGVYSLVFGSKLPTAKKFKHWVTSEVLPAEENPGYLNATKLAERIGMKNGKGNPDAKGVNAKLCALGLQTKPDKKNWRLTPEGKKYGEEKPYTRGGHSGYQIAWSDKVLDVLKA